LSFLSTALIILPVFAKKYFAVSRYKQILVTAVDDEGSEDIITKTSDISEKVKFFIISYTVDGKEYKVCRQDITVPNKLKKNKKMECSQAIAFDEFGNQRNVTDILKIYSGPSGDFLGNDLSLQEILKHHLVYDVYCILIVTRSTSWLHIFQNPSIQIHMSSYKVSVSL
jgi:hypothetical protein